MKKTGKEMKSEAVLRMKMFDMLPQPIREFTEEGKLNQSELIGMLYWLSDEQERIVRNWEEETGNMVYHVIHSMTNFGEMLTFLYVSDDDEEWELDRDDIKNGMALCYVYNVTMPDLSEYGSCGIKPCNGGVIRTY